MNQMESYKYSRNGHNYRLYMDTEKIDVSTYALKFKYLKLWDFFFFIKASISKSISVHSYVVAGQMGHAFMKNMKVTKYYTSIFY